MKYSIDKILDDIATLENVETKQITEVNTKDLPEEIHEGSILILEDGKYKLDLNEEEIRRKRIEEKFNKLRNKN